MLCTSLHYQSGLISHYFPLLILFLDENPFISDWYCIQRFLHCFPSAHLLQQIQLLLHGSFPFWPFWGVFSLFQAGKLITSNNCKGFLYGQEGFLLFLFWKRIMKVFVVSTNSTCLPWCININLFLNFILLSFLLGFKVTS